MVNKEEAKREKWSETEISVDHPKRKAEYIRDATVFSAGLTTTITGLHCDIQVLDDVVVQENAYTKETRDKVAQQYSLLSSIGGTKARQLVVGTRYHPEDLYATMMGMKLSVYNEDKTLNRTENLYEKFERQVESVGDGTGEFLWPKQQRYDGVEFGFDQNILEQKKSQFIDLGMFYAQYYNNPNSLESGGIAPECFQYYDKVHLKQEKGNWYFKDSRLNLIASIDFAFSLRSQADYTAIVVVGVDGNNNYYVLDIDRFKSKKINEYYEHIWSVYKKWEFRTLIAEVNQAQEVIVEDIKNNYIYRDGLSLSVQHFRPNRSMGAKEERIDAVLQPKYSNGQIWHYKGGNCQILEEELVQRHPPHDDIKDSLATAVSLAKPPTSFARRLNNIKDQLVYHARFGGLA